MTKSNTLKVTTVTLALVFAAFVSVGMAAQYGGMMNQGNGGNMINQRNNGSMMNQQGNTNCPRYQGNSENHRNANFQHCQNQGAFGNRGNMMNQGSSNQNNMMNQGNGVDVNTGR
ncbi:MAG: hypothetical protein L3J57_14185 [Desulfuromusa sp.]|nr:hypothetical protein [Desulfuromusa sp.]